MRRFESSLRAGDESAIEVVAELALEQVGYLDLVVDTKYAGIGGVHLCSFSSCIVRATIKLEL